MPQSNSKDLNKFKCVEKQHFSNIDRKTGVVNNVSVITGNREASGHGMYVDETMVEQVVEKGNSRGELGIKARFDHPNPCARSMGTVIGTFKNFRKEGERAVADLHLLETAKNSPDGDLHNYILDLATERPDLFGTSIVFTSDEDYIPQKEDYKDLSDDDPFLLPHARVKELWGADVVDEAAANDGLFGRPNYLAEQADAWASEHPEIIKKVLDNYFKSMKMDEKKTLLEKAKNLIATIFSVEEPKTEAEVKKETVDKVEYDKILAENAELKVKIEVGEKARVDFETATNAKVEELKATVAKLSEEPIGKPIVDQTTSPVITKQTPQEIIADERKKKENK